MRRCGQTRAIQRSAALDCRLPAPVAGGRARFALAQAAYRAQILASKPRVSGECRLNLANIARIRVRTYCPGVAIRASI
jgi:hypothetical protein